MDKEINNSCAVQWFPGHMTKTSRSISKNIKLVDIVIEITDARIPKSSRNPELDKLISTKPRIVVLNKCDMADKCSTQKWIEYYKNNGIYSLAMDCRTGKGTKDILPLVRLILQDKIKRFKDKGMIGSPIAMMIVGVPNVGKSSFINRMSTSKSTKVEDRPGVTRGLQWIKVDKDIDMIDVPGVLWPKFDDVNIGEKLAFTGAVKDQVVDIELLSIRLIDVLRLYYIDNIISRYKIDKVTEDMDSFEILKLIGKKRGMLISGGEIDTERASIMLLDEYRSGKLGRITLELPSNILN